MKCKNCNETVKPPRRKYCSKKCLTKYYGKTQYKKHRTKILLRSKKRRGIMRMFVKEKEHHLKQMSTEELIDYVLKKGKHKE